MVHDINGGQLLIHDIINSDTRREKNYNPRKDNKNGVFFNPAPPLKLSVSGYLSHEYFESDSKSNYYIFDYNCIINIYYYYY